MSVLIKGVEMPKEKIVISITPDGEVQRYDRMFGHTFGKKFEAVLVPPHGRLIDADALYEDCALDHSYEVAVTTTRVNEYMQLKIDSAPTVIPAEEGET